MILSSVGGESGVVLVSLSSAPAIDCVEHMAPSGGMAFQREHLRSRSVACAHGTRAAVARLFVGTAHFKAPYICHFSSAGMVCSNVVLYHLCDTPASIFMKFPLMLVWCTGIAPQLYPCSSGFCADGLACTASFSMISIHHSCEHPET